MTEKKTWTVQSLLDWSRQFFTEKNIDSPALTAQILLGKVLGMSKVELIIHGLRPMSETELAAYKALVLKRVKEHLPTAYILGEREFWSLPLCVTPDVLIPRPDTECLVEKVLEYLRARESGGLPVWARIEADTGDVTYEKLDERSNYYRENYSHEIDQSVCEAGGSPETDTENAHQSGTEPEVAHEKLAVLDVGTGSGAIILALASELSDEKYAFYAVDISDRALNVARQNAAANHLDHIQFAQSDLFSGVDIKADIIVSNPPYVSDEEMQALSPEVRCEPDLALRAGTDGLDVYRRLIPEAVRHLHPGGALFVEIGCAQAEAVSALFKASGFGMVKVFKDYGQRPRVAVGIL